ncbi:gelation factor [Tieghemostelium lacteum]|uniref:Gelation factor n=1 Tax=Tieghemostelium lacteum TaxID=361077 RepID=A0A151ZSG4_TIELA|nr:gelation factor [Tieghemostelium lacteum]|eukprot:KYQ96878.1 gelation factor [Tieghemostelium lacteum]
MSGTVQPTKTWIDVQKKTFTGWANNYLKERILKINDLGQDLEDGVLLINLLEIISSKKILKFNKQPKIRMQKIENNNFAINFIKQEGLKLVGIGAEDIVDCQLKLILGLIWTLILRYQIQMSEDENSPKAALLEWVRKQVQPYGCKVDNFTEHWTDGRVLSALTDSLKPGVLDMNTLSGDAITDVDRAMDLAEQHYEIPKIMDPSDMVNLPDELSVITYVSYFRDYALNKAKRDQDAAEALERRRRNFSDKDQVVVEGAGLFGGYVNRKAPFVIKAMNYYGEPIPRGGENFAATVVGNNDQQALAVKLVDNQNGIYDCSYLPTLPQTYTLRVTLEGEEVVNSPWSPKIDGATVQSNAYGPGLEGGLVGQPAKFKIQSRDDNGQPLTEGGDEFAVTVTGPNGQIPASLSDNGDGSYDASYTPVKGGEHTVVVTIRGEPLAQGSSHPTIFNSDVNQSYCEGPGFEKAQARRQTEFKIHSVHSDGKHATEGGDPFDVSIHGPHEVNVSISDNEDGSYTVTYTPAKDGEYEIHVTLDGKPIKDIPKSIHIKPAADPNLSYAEGPGLEGGRENEQAQFKIHAVDPDGNHRTDGGDGFVVTIDGPSTVDPTLIDNGDGTYDVDFTATEPGDYTINLTLDGDNVNGFPKVVTIKPVAVSENSYAHGPGLIEAYDNATAEFTIFAVDKNGQARKDGGDPFVVQITGPQGNVEAKLHDNSDGTYLVQYDPDVVGEYNINVTLKDTPIKNMPVSVNSIEGADGSLSNFGSFTFTVAANNKKGEPKTTGGDKFYVAITGPAEFIKLEALDNQDGSYTAKYTLQGNGRFSTDVKLNGKSIEGSPFKQVLGNPGKKNPDVKSFTTEAKCNFLN